MKFVSLILATSFFLLPSTVALSNEILIAIKDDKTIIECDFANIALKAGFFRKLSKPEIVGTCHEADNPHETLEPINIPIWPGQPPVAPWCDCTNEQYENIQKQLIEHSIIINPGYQLTNQGEAWARAYGTSSAEFYKEDNWPDGEIPAFELFKNERFLTAK